MGSKGDRGGEALNGFLAELVETGVVTAAVAVVADAREALARAAAGERVPGTGAAVAIDDLFDAASLTKPFVATLALRLDAADVLPLDTPIGALVPEARTELARLPLEDLLRHRSGLAPWYPLWSGLRPGVFAAAPRRSVDEHAARRSPQPARTPERSPRAERGRGWERASGSHRRRALDRPHGAGEAAECESAAERLVEWLAREAPLGAAPGSYSDLGFLLWSALATRVGGHPLEVLLRRQVLAPLGLSAADVQAAPAAGDQVVACVLDDGKERELAAGLGLAFEPEPPADGGAGWRGVPQDRNARFLGGLAGHAGLFVSADALVALGREWLAPGRLLEPDSVRRALAGARGPFALGWARQSRDGSSGLALAATSFGHSGFTGGSLWIDPERERILVLLAHRASTGVDFNPHRRAFHRLACTLFG
jgi:CubicO group peptidase (beta-lactamase class C family)